MLSRAGLPVLIAVLLGAVLAGCGGDSDDDNSDQNGATSTPRTAAPTSPAATSATPTALTGNPDEKTPGPGTEESPVRTLGATAPPPATEGTPAVEPPDTVAYLSQFQNSGDLGEEGCTYDPSTRLTDCGPRGLFSVRPPLGGQDIYCSVTIVGGAPEFIRCTSAEPSETKWYEIQ